MDDVFFGYVYDFGAREEWVAERGRGALLDGAALRRAAARRTPIEILSLEGTTTEAIAAAAPALRGVARRLRVMGSLALSLCHLAAGRVDAVCCLKPARSIDIAAAQLLVRERGYAIELFEDPPFGGAPLDLGQRSRVVAAATDDLCAQVAGRDCRARRKRCQTPLPSRGNGSRCVPIVPHARRPERGGVCV